MKRILLIVLGIASLSGLKAQNCEAIMLPFFGGNEKAMYEYPEPKFEWRCKYSQNAFYVTDQVPEDAEIRSLGEIYDKLSGAKLTDDFVVDLDVLSYYQYTFLDMQAHYPKPNVTICFPTPNSSHRYLVLRSLDETYRRTEFPENYLNEK